MKKLLSLTLALVMIVTCLAGISFAADPIATVVTGSKSVDVFNEEELAAAIDPSGNSVVTMKADIFRSTNFVIPYSCTIDMNGHTWETDKGNALTISAAGTENKTTVLKNGTVIHKVVGLRVDEGGLIVSNMTMRGLGGACVCPYDNNPEYNNVNLIENSVLVSDIYGTVGYNKKDTDFTNSNITIKDTIMVCPKEAGSVNFIKNGSTCIPGTVTLGTGVEIYSYKPDSYAVAGYTIAGETLTAETALAAVEIPAFELKFAAMSKWSTPATPAPVEPAAPAEPTTPAAPSVPSTTTPDTTVPATGVSVVALGVMAMVSLAGAVIVKKH